MRIIIEIDETQTGAKTTVVTPSTPIKTKLTATSTVPTSSIEDIDAGGSVENVEMENENSRDNGDQLSPGAATAGEAPVI